MERRAPLVAIAIVLLVTGCSQPVGDRSDNSAANAVAVQNETRPSLFHPPADLEELTNKVRKATYIVGCGSSYGSGYGYETSWDEERQEFIVTTQTVIQECLDLGMEPTVLDSNRDEVSVSIAASRKSFGDPSSAETNRDVAILRPRTLGIRNLARSPQDLKLAAGS